MTNKQAFEYMNELGRQRESFLFILDFDVSKPLVFPLFEIENSAEILFDLNGKRNFTPLSKNLKKMMKQFKVIKGDITKCAVDAIVNAANTSLMGGGGVDGAIHRAGGSAILDDCRKIVARQGGCKVGEAVITTGGKLSAKFVIHTVGPVWHGGENGESDLLGNCYWNSLELALKNGIKSIAFPNISTGIYRFPKINASYLAIDAVTEFLIHHENDAEQIEEVIFVCFDDENYQIYKESLPYT